MDFIFLKQAAGGPTGWGLRGPVGPAACSRNQWYNYEEVHYIRTKFQFLYSQEQCLVGTKMWAGGGGLYW